MRSLILITALLGVGIVQAPALDRQAAAHPGDLAGLERSWKTCVRDAFGHQPPGQSRAGGQRNALDECQQQEDDYVKAVLEAQASEDAEARRGGRTMTARAREWAASVAAYVVDPVSSWLAILRR